MSDELDALLRNITISSRNSSRFDSLRDWFARTLAIDADLVVSKFFADPKNYRNRISEALRNKPRLLVAILDETSRVETVELAIASRWHLAPEAAVVIVGRADGRWTALKVLSGQNSARGIALHPAFDHVPHGSIAAETRPGASIPSIERAELETLLRRQTAWSAEQLHDALIARFGLQPSMVCVKQVGADKNIGNRVFEAVGVGAKILILDAGTLRPKVREQVEILAREHTIEIALVFGSDPTRAESIDLVLASQPGPTPKTSRSEATMTTDDQANTPAEALQFRSLKLVDELVEHIPFDAQNQKLFEEHEAHESGLNYETRALAHIRGLLSDPSVSLIVLTGDAGHGKTHLCRRLLQYGGLSAEDALQKICNDHAGRTPIVLPEGKRPVRIIKDLSEFEPEDAAQLLVDLLDDESTIGIVCANEGRLRAVTSRQPQRLTVILDTLERGLVHGETADETRRIHVINLNFQAAAPLDDQRGFLRYLLDAWTGDKRKWRSCASCKAKPHCPISRNRERLAGLGAGSASSAWRDGLIQLIRTAEQTSYVLTFRETLILIAYLLSGGLRCSDVHELIQRGQYPSLAKYQLERLLFEQPLAEAEAEQLRVLMRMRRYDPGLVPHRDVDEGIIEALEFEDALGEEVWFGAARVPHTRTQLRSEATSFATLVRNKRREAYFEVATQGPNGILERARRLGLYHYGRFDHVQGSDEEPAQMKSIVAQVIAGLHVVQGIRPPDTTHLYIVDPAFSRSGSGTAVIAARVRRNKLWLRGLHEYWQDKKQGATPTLTEAVDWLDRVIVLKDDDDHALLELDLMQFEFILRAAEGVAFAAFHASERRRILTKLAQLAERLPRESDTIHIVVADNICEVIVDRDGSIEVPERGQ